ncbi:chymotrypsin-like elastase family member 2B isoform X2 [Belonocnema kinseyi]|uniref:chymotrypsin-like elastase family member 2B isoform X2 n=1 Tax=Belonocnema kinseyi TaxID=2817044 RepID=UPI00143D4868|nr:chymotrypsin-like elastase family member 2B isoform X2 [Belonocnema kinseyi]
MNNAAFGILFLVNFINIGYSQLPQSPCPQYFQYQENEITGEIFGIVAIPPPLPKDTALMLRVTLHYPTLVLSKYKATLELIRSRMDYAPVQQAIDQGKPLFFTLRFSPRDPLPIVKQIVFNNQLICSDVRATWPVFTSVDLEKTLYPPGLLSLLTNQSTSTNNPNRPSQEQLSQPILFPSISSGKCGISENANLSIDIRFGWNKTYPGEWPWLVAIFSNLKGKFEHRCIGNLISNKHIITVYLGKYNLWLANEIGSVKANISAIRIHPEFNNNFTNADSDLAILVLKNPVKYSDLILPICLWKDSTNLKKIVGETGTIVGWRKYGKHYTGEPHKTIEQIVSQENCLRSNPGFAEITSNRTFCAGSRDGSGPCYGDSGSGFVIQDPKTERYHLRGIVSLTLFDDKVRTCDLKQYVVYVDVAKHLAWIKKQISNDLH